MTAPKKTKKRKRKKKPIIKNGFIYEADLTGCEEFIELNYSAPTQPLYRWVDSPAREINFVPQYYLEEKELNDNDLELEVSIEERVGRNTVSMFTSEEASKKKYKNVIYGLRVKDKRLNNDPENGELAHFMKKCGPYIGRVILDENDAVVSVPNQSGHVDVLLKRGFDYKKNLDPTFGLKYMLDDDEGLEKNK